MKDWHRTALAFATMAFLFGVGFYLGEQKARRSANRLAKTCEQRTRVVVAACLAEVPPEKRMHLRMRLDAAQISVWLAE